jgi:hypothetical protein
MWVAKTLADAAPSMSQEQLREMQVALGQLFGEFGDGCNRPDAAWGWRVVGNGMLVCGRAGREMLEAMLTERHGADRAQDRWLAWAAYQVLYVLQSPDRAILCTEKEAVETHAKYAPPFPGHRA